MKSELDSAGLSKNYAEYPAEYTAPAFQGRHDSFTEAGFKLLFGHIRVSLRNIC
jgi:hypothetical protein